MSTGYGHLIRPRHLDADDLQDTYIFPLRETFFEGTPAKIPFAYKEVLEAEYKQKALTLTDFEG